MFGNDAGERQQPVFALKMRFLLCVELFILLLA